MSAAEPEPTVPHPPPLSAGGSVARSNGEPSARAASPVGSPRRGRSSAGSALPGHGGGGSTAVPVARTTVLPRLRRTSRGGGSTRVRRPADAPRIQLPRLSRTRLVLLGAGLLVLLGVAVYALFFSTWLVMKTVEVEGNSTVSTAEVLGAADLVLGEPLARVDTDAAADRVAALLPVGSVDLRRAWPDTLVITVTERHPALAIVDAGGYSVLDPTGFSFRHVDTAPARVPLLRTTGPAPIDAAVQKAVLGVVPHVPEAVRARVVDITAVSIDAITLHLTDGVTVVWGSAEDGPRKAQVLTELMRTPATAYNVSAPDVPAIRPLPTSES